jgi:hypothetical protein
MQEMGETIEHNVHRIAGIIASTAGCLAGRRTHDMERVLQCGKIHGINANITGHVSICEPKQSFIASCMETNASLHTGMYTANCDDVVWLSNT